MTQRSNYQWVHDLRQNSPTRNEAVRDLNEFLERSLYHYLTHRTNEPSDYRSSELRHVARKFAGESLTRVLDNLPSFQGTSQFTTWAAKFAARIATTWLKGTHHKGPEAGSLTLAVDNAPAESGAALPVERSELAGPIADWEGEGGFVLQDEAIT